MGRCGQVTLAMVLLLAGGLFQSLAATAQERPGWEKFTNPNSQEAMAAQLRDFIRENFKKARYNTPEEVGRVAEAFDEERDVLEAKWQRDYDRSERNLRNARIDLLNSRNGISERELITRLIDSRGSELERQAAQAKGHQKSLTTLLAAIPYFELVAGGAEELYSVQETNRVLIAAMGRSAVKSINEIQIGSEQVIKNNRLVKELISRAQAGHFKVDDSYGERLETFDQTTGSPNQIRLVLFEVFPFRVHDGGGRSGQIGQTVEVLVLSEDNRNDVFAQLGLQEDAKIAAWLAKALEKAADGNRKASRTVERAISGWEEIRDSLGSRTRRIVAQIVSLREMLNEAPKITGEEAKQAYKKAAEAHMALLNSRAKLRRETVPLRRPEKGSVGEHWANLGVQALEALIRQSGNVTEKLTIAGIDVVDFKQENVAFTQKVLGFRLLGVTVRKQGNANIYATTVGFRVALSPPEGKSLRDPVTGLVFAWVPKGKFEMGCGRAERSCQSSNSPPHQVELEGFWLSRGEVTNEAYLKFADETGTGDPVWRDEKSPFNIESGRNTFYRKLGAPLTHPASPVVGVTWFDAMAYARWATEKARGTTRKKYQLPTEAEWEYACRGGGQRNAFGTSSGTASEKEANLDGGKDGFPVMAPSGSFAPNSFGLVDMSGNVSEWVLDTYSEQGYLRHAGKNPLYQGPGSKRVRRGGSWKEKAKAAHCSARRAMKRGFADALVGFRIVREP